MAGKTSGVTITPAQPRVLPSGSTNLGYGISISRTTLGAKSSSPSLASLPSGITISSLGSGFSPRPGGGIGYASVQAHTSNTPPPAKAEKVKLFDLSLFLFCCLSPLSPSLKVPSFLSFAHTHAHTHTQTVSISGLCLSLSLIQYYCIVNQ